MKRFVVLLFVNLLVARSASYAQYGQIQQTLQLVDIKGGPVEEKKYVDVVGDQYLHTDWQNGAIMLESNQIVTAPLKFDAYNNILLFKDKDDKELQPKNALKGFIINISDKEISDMVPLMFVKGFPPTGKQNEDTFYQMIADGKVKLLKLHRKKIQEQSTFTSGVVTKTFKLYQSYFIVKDNQLIAVDPGKKSLSRALPDHSVDIDAYFKNHSINFSSDNDLRTFFVWYNTL
jgi:hypothetical protein